MHPTTPTAMPSALPSAPPSLSPSTAPTHFPSKSPSSYPTADPSVTPSESPTACVDEDKAISSNDGVDIIANHTLEISRIFSRISNISEIIIDINATSMDYYAQIPFRKSVNCDGNVDACFIDCMYRGPCTGGNVQNDAIIMEQFIINCIGIGACWQTHINMTRSTFEHVYIECKQNSSCDSMKMYFSAHKLGYYIFTAFKRVHALK